MFMFALVAAPLGVVVATVAVDNAAADVDVDVFDVELCAARGQQGVVCGVHLIQLFVRGRTRGGIPCSQHTVDGTNFELQY